MNITQKLANLFRPSPRSNGKSSDARRTDLPTNQANNQRCEFTFSDGRRCRNQHAQFCLHHSSSKQRDCGAEAAPDAALVGLVALCGDLTTATNINQALAQVYLLMAQGRIPQKQAVTFGYLSQLLLQTVPGIRSEYVSAHGYRAWEQRLKSSLEANQSPEPSPTPSSPPVGENNQPMNEDAELEEGEYYVDIYRRSLDLLDRKYDTTPEGRREGKALLLELELMNPAPAKPRRDFFGQTVDLVRRLHEHESEISAPIRPASQSPSVSRPSAPAPPSARAASAPPATPEPAFCSSGHPSEASLLGEGGSPEAVSASSSDSLTASARPPQSCSSGRGRAVCDRDLRQLAAVTSAVPADTPAPSAQAAVAPPSPANPNRTAHSTDWYAPASWSGRQPDPFPSRQEKLKRQLREMSDRRRQHQNQSRAFWR